MHVEVWSDIACPWCWLGKHHLEEAIRRLDGNVEVTVEMHSYELDPSPRATVPILEHLRQVGGDLAAIQAAHRRLTEMGRRVGLVFDFDRQLRANTFDAHRVHHLGIMSGRGPALVERLMQAYHAEGEDLASHDTLARLAAEVELEPSDVARTLRSNDFADTVRRDEALAKEIGIDGVPFFLFDDEYAVSGAQPIATFVDILRRLARAPPRAPVDGETA